MAVLFYYFHYYTFAYIKRNFWLIKVSILQLILRKSSVDGRFATLLYNKTNISIKLPGAKWPRTARKSIKRKPATWF